MIWLNCTFVGMILFAIGFSSLIFTGVILLNFNKKSSRR